jgi:hypothetical protein
MPAGWTELSDSPHMGVSPVRTQGRVDRRAQRKVARRSQQRWTLVACSILAGAFGLTVGILDVLH